jgi:hypothetical protein
MTKKPDWPRELREPFSPQRIADQAVGEVKENESPAERISQLFYSEVKRRVMLMAGYLDMWRPPSSETDWLQFVYYLCLHWNIPAFQEASKKRPGAKKKWTDKRREELFTDVMSLVQRTRMTESAACRHVALNPSKFLERYPTNPKTLHREFLRAKKAFERDLIPF